MTYHRTAGKNGTRNRKVNESAKPKSKKSTAKGYTRKPRKG